MVCPASGDCKYALDECMVCRESQTIHTSKSPQKLNYEVLFLNGVIIPALQQEMNPHIVPHPPDVVNQPKCVWLQIVLL